MNVWSGNVERGGDADGQTEGCGGCGDGGYTAVVVLVFCMLFHCRYVFLFSLDFYSSRCCNYLSYSSTTSSSS